VEGVGFVEIDVVVGLGLWGSALWWVWIGVDRHGEGCGFVEIGMEEGVEQWTTAFMVDIGVCGGKWRSFLIDLSLQ